MKIQAYAAREPGGHVDLFMYERAMDPHDVLIKVSHCTIATGDIQMMNNAWGDSKFPCVPGHEIIGTIEATGTMASGLKNGDRVGVGYQVAACFACDQCIEGHEQFCLNQKVIGVDMPGGLAHHMVVDGRFAFKIPASMNAATSAPLLSSGLTVYTAIMRAKLAERSTVAVLGIGGLGHLAIQFLSKMGHNVIALSHTATKKDLAQRFGATFITIKNLNEKDYIRKFDFILSTLNVDYDLDFYLRMLSPQGKLCVVGQPLHKASFTPGLLYDYAQRTIYGNYTGSRQDMIDMLGFAAVHNIQSIVEMMPFAQMNEAIERVKKDKSIMRLVLHNDDQHAIER